MLPLSLPALPTQATPAALPSIAEIYDLHVDSVVRMARGLGVPPASIDDLVQDVFLVIHRKLPTFEGRAQLKTWIAGIVLNVVRTHRRAHKRQRALAPIDAELLEDERARPPDDAALHREAVKLLMEILDAMPDDQRTVFVFAELEGLEMHQIAESLGISANTAYSRLRLARKIYDRSVERLRARGDWRQR